MNNDPYITRWVSIQRFEKVFLEIPPALHFPKGEEVICWNSMNPEAFSLLKKGMKGGFPVFSKN
jgi:hypothetical protein